MIQVQYSHGTSWHDPTSTSHDASHLTVTASHCGRRCHDSSFTVTVTAQFHSDSQWSSSQSESAATRSPGPAAACTPGRPPRRRRRGDWPAARPGRSAPAALAGRDWPDVGWRQPEAHGTAASSSLSRTRSSPESGESVGNICLA